MSTAHIMLQKNILNFLADQSDIMKKTNTVNSKDTKLKTVPQKSTNISFYHYLSQQPVTSDQDIKIIELP